MINLAIPAWGAGPGPHQSPIWGQHPTVEGCRPQRRGAVGLRDERGNTATGPRIPYQDYSTGRRGGQERQVAWWVGGGGEVGGWLVGWVVEAFQ